MLGLSHVLLHVGLCNAVARVKAETLIPVHVRLAYRQVGPQPGIELDKTYRVERGDGDDTIVEFDVARGLYKMTLDTPAYNCSASDFIEILPDRSREITENLKDGPAPPDPFVLLYGTAPTSFVYAKPTFVVFDKSVTCNGPVTTPLHVRIVSEHDRDSYYTWLYTDPSLGAQGSTVVALRLSTPTHLYHYVRLPIPFPVPWVGWPDNIHFDVTEDELDGLATEKTDTLLCPKLWETTVH